MNRREFLRTSAVIVGAVAVGEIGAVSLLAEPKVYLSPSYLGFMNTDPCGPVQRYCNLASHDEAALRQVLSDLNDRKVIVTAATKDNKITVYSSWVTVAEGETLSATKVFDWNEWIELKL